MTLALALGTLLAIAALAFVLYPLFFSVAERSGNRQLSSTATPSGDREFAVVALREIELDRATGKLSDVDYAQLEGEYTERAVRAMRAERAAEGIGLTPGSTDDAIEAAVLAYRVAHPDCASCGPRPEPDAVYCSTCGRYLRGACHSCGAMVDEAGAQFCIRCGERLAA